VEGLVFDKTSARDGPMTRGQSIAAIVLGDEARAREEAERLAARRRQREAEEAKAAVLRAAAGPAADKAALVRAQGAERVGPEDSVPAAAVGIGAAEEDERRLAASAEDHGRACGTDTCVCM